MNNEFNILLEKLKGFKRKYYTNLILKGLIISFSIILVMYLFAIAYEYFAWNNSVIRTVIFYLFNVSAIVVLFYYIIIPLSKLARIGKTLTNDQAAKIIGKHFPDVNDKLLNTLQLEQLKSENNLKADLLIAGVDQKAAALSPIPFKRAIDLKKNKRFLKYIIPPLLIIIISLIVFPAFITEPSTRILKYNEVYTKPLPYTINLLNNDFEVLQKENYTVKLKVEGEIIPSDIRIDDGYYMYRMANEGKGIYYYTFKDVSNDIYFKIVTDDYKSELVHLRVIPKPIIFSFNVILDYPDYLRKKNDLIENSGDLVIPEGTEIEWQIFAKDATKVIFKNAEREVKLTEAEDNIFMYKQKSFQNFWYSLFAENQFVKNNDSLSYTVQVIKDEFPGIDVNAIQDEKAYGFVYFNGTLNDDHGYHSFKFWYREDEQVDAKWKSISLNVDRDLPKQFFSYTLQSEQLGLTPGMGISYYFEVRDNDALNGFKRTKTVIQKYHLEGLEEIEEKLKSTSDKIKEKIKKLLSELENINKRMEERQIELFDKKELSWQDKKQLSDLLNKQKDIEKQLSELKELNDELESFEDILSKENSEQLQEKIEQLDQMMDELAMKDVEQMQKELEKIDKDKLNEMLNDLETQNHNLKTDLEQNLELYKQLEFEKKVQETINKLKDLAEEQDKLADDTKEKNLDVDQAKEQQENINDQFQDIENDLSESEKLNNELEDPFDFSPDQQEMDQINQDLNNASEKLQQGKQKKASESQKSAGEKMNNMADGLSLMMQSAMESRLGEDVEKIKNILDNLIDLSFSQEELIDLVKLTNQNDPVYVENLSELQILKDGYLSLHDSLIALSKRQIAVQQFIVKESDKINLHINKALLYLQDRKVGQALNDQQYSMTSMNNLALMLSESLDQMQAGMKMSGKNAGKQCPNPGEGESDGLKQIIQMQKGLNKGMQEGKMQQGLQGEQGLNQQSEQLARMAAMQGEIRKKLNEYLDRAENQKGSNGDLSKLIDEMKKAEEEIVNRKITKETLERQKQIEVRLLKSERAKLEREKKETRRSQEGINRKKENSGLEFNPKNEKNSKEDFLQTIPIEMTPYFNDLLKRYLYKIETKNGS